MVPNDLDAYEVLQQLPKQLKNNVAQSKRLGMKQVSKRVRTGVSSKVSRICQVLLASSPLKSNDLDENVPSDGRKAESVMWMRIRMQSDSG